MSAAGRIGFGDVIRGARRKQGRPQAELCEKSTVPFEHHDHQRGGNRVGAGLKRELEGDS